MSQLRFSIERVRFALVPVEGGDHVTMTGHARAGMGNRS